MPSARKKSRARLTSRNSDHVSSACTSCRRKKIKCDGSQATCAPCAEAGLECVWTVKNDRRITREGPCTQCGDKDAYIAKLEARVGDLEERLAVATSAPASTRGAESQTESPARELDSLPSGTCNPQSLFAPADAYTFPHAASRLVQPAEAGGPPYEAPTAAFAQPAQWGSALEPASVEYAAYIPAGIFAYTSQQYFAGTVVHDTYPAHSWAA